MELTIVGEIKFKNCVLAVYGDLDAPLFRAQDVADLIEYGSGNVWNLVNLCEDDEHMLLTSPNVYDNPLAACRP